MAAPSFARIRGNGLVAAAIARHDRRRGVRKSGREFRKCLAKCRGVRQAGAGRGSKFSATGISLCCTRVIHSCPPFTPLSFHEGDRSWFGGGSDLTPLSFREDVIQFHKTWKACERHGRSSIPQNEADARKYFFRLSQRTAGGGIF